MSFAQTESFTNTRVFPLLFFCAKVLLKRCARSVRLALLVLLCSRASPFVYGAASSELAILSPRHPYDLNPHTSQYNTESQILSGLYEGLYTADPATGEPLLAIAKSAKVSRKGTRWTFIINDGLKFSDGSPLTANSVRDSWLTLLSTKNAPYASLLDIIKGAKEYRLGTADINAVGISAIDNTVSIELNCAAAHLPKLLCMTAFAVAATAPNGEPLYSGAYILDHIDDNEALLTKNPNYISADKVALDEITFRFSDSDSDNAFSYNTGLCDWVAAAVDLDKLLDKNAAHIMAEFATEYLFFKIRNNVWKNVAFREALLTAIPYDSLRDKTFVSATTLTYPIMGYPQVNGWTSSDISDAKSLMKRARESVGIGDAPLTIKIATMATDRAREQSKLLQDAWKPLGVNTEIVEIAPNEYLSTATKSNSDSVSGVACDAVCDIYSYTWIGDYFDPLAFLELFRSDSTLNVACYKNATFDKLLLEAANTLDGQKRLAILSQAEQQLLDDCVVIPIQHPVSLNVIDLSAIGGWALNSFDIHPLKYLYKKDSLDTPALPGFVCK